MIVLTLVANKMLLFPHSLIITLQSKKIFSFNLPTLTNCGKCNCYSQTTARVPFQQQQKLVHFLTTDKVCVPSCAFHLQNVVLPPCANPAFHLLPFLLHLLLLPSRVVVGSSLTRCNDSAATQKATLESGEKKEREERKEGRKEGASFSSFMFSVSVLFLQARFRCLQNSPMRKGKERKAQSGSKVHSVELISKISTYIKEKRKKGGETLLGQVLPSKDCSI